MDIVVDPLQPQTLKTLPISWSAEDALRQTHTRRPNKIVRSRTLLSMRGRGDEQDDAALVEHLRVRRCHHAADEELRPRPVRAGVPLQDEGHRHAPGAGQ